MKKTLRTAEWYPLDAPYDREQLPGDLSLYYVILAHDQSALMGQIVVVPEEVLLFLVENPFGQIDARQIGGTHFMLVPKPGVAFVASQAADLTFFGFDPFKRGEQLADAYLSDTKINDFAHLTDAQIMALRHNWYEMTRIRYAGEVLDNVPAPYNAYPGSFWEALIHKVEQEIKRRMSSISEATAEEPQAFEYLDNADEPAASKTFRDEWPLARGKGMDHA